MTGSSTSGDAEDVFVLRVLLRARGRFGTGSDDVRGGEGESGGGSRMGPRCYLRLAKACAILSGTNMPSVYEMLRAARVAQRSLARCPAAQRTAALERVAARIDAGRRAIEAANALDLEASPGLSPALRDRLALGPARLDAVVRAVRAIRDLDDPLDEERLLGVRPNGLRVSKRRVPLGTVAIIYEARPNVTAEAAALCLRSGNAVVLRGGKEALRTNMALAACIRSGLRDAEVDPDAVQLVEDLDRERVRELLTATGLVDLAIPRGGPALMQMVDAWARVPVVRHGAGVCHVYVDASADLSMAADIALNAKTHRPGVCNAAETLLVHRGVAGALLARLGPALAAAGVTLRADPEAARALAAAGVAAEPAAPADWDTEFLALVMAVKVVDHLDGALAHIAAHGTEHTASIVTGDESAAERFLREVDASCVLVNASTRFNDGGELGLGAEMGISTSRMHAWGPMGVRELTTEKYVVRGAGQVRQ